MPDATDSHDVPAFRPLAFFAAMVLPGLGHVVGGERSRGLCAGAGVLGLFACGLLVGGIDTVDSREDLPWFIGQACVGPLTFAVDAVHQQHFKVVDPVTHQLRSANPDEGRGEDKLPIAHGTPPNRKSIAKMNEIGTLFSTVAGMVNVIVIIDAGFPRPRGPRKPAPAAPQPAAQAGVAP